MNGTIKRLKSDSGFGFIRPDGGDGKDDYFFHKSGLAVPSEQQHDAFANLREGQAVTFETERSPKGPRACQVRVVG